MRRREIDVSALPVIALDHNAPLWWGQTMLVAIETSAFALLIAVYFYLRLGVDVWPPPGVQLPPLTFPTIALILMILSCVPSYFASEAAKKNDRMGVIIGLGINVVVALIAFGIRLYEWRILNFKWNTDAHGSIVWFILYLHSIDYVALVIESITLIVIFAVGRYGPKQRQGVHVDSITWYFVVAIWILLYGTIYVAPRFMHT